MPPKTRFNRRVSPHRVTDALIMDLAEVKAVKNCVEGATVNDVIELTASLDEETRPPAESLGDIASSVFHSPWPTSSWLARDSAISSRASPAVMQCRARFRARR